MSKAVARELNKVPGPFNHADPQGPNYTPSWVNGNPTLATREKGEQLILRDVTERLAGLKAGALRRDLVFPSRLLRELFPPLLYDLSRLPA